MRRVLRSNLDIMAGKMKVVLFIMLLSFFVFSGCTSKSKHVQEDADIDADSGTVDIDTADDLSDEVLTEAEVDETADIPDEAADETLDEASDSDADSDTAEPKVCTDIGCDGYPDIVFSNTDTDTTTNINSFVYLGSATGYSAENRIEIPTIGAMGVDYADVNKDGYLDIAFASVKEKKETDSEENRYTVSLLYYGTKDGFDLENRVEFPTVGCSDVTLVDLDKDGWVDLITSNRYNGSGMTGSGYKINSYVYWGSEYGFDINFKLELPTVGAAMARVADLNGDGFNDILFPNGVQEYVGVFESYIYWETANSKFGWSEASRTTLPSVSPEGATIDDINDDGFLDIFISGWLCLTKCDLKNRIYWGSATGFNKDVYTKIEGVDGGTDAVFTDLNGDGNKDLVFASGAVDLLTQEFSKVSYIMWGEPSGNADKYKWSTDNMQEIPATAASEEGVRDLNGDGFLDIVFASHYPPTDADPQVSQIYWGGMTGYGITNMTELPTQHAAGMKIIGTYNP